MSKTLKQPKAWYQRKRLWGILIAVLLIYFCLVPSRTRISPETTGIVEPLTADGQVDYFAAFEKTYIDKLSPPEDNGQRLLIAAFGPVVLEQMALVNTVPWEEILTDENGKNWFENYWLPLCEHLYIDPYRKPTFYEKRGFFGFMHQLKRAEKEKAGEENFKDDDPDSMKLFRKLTSAPWKKEDVAEVGKWLDEYSEALDYFGMCARKPHFACWRKGHMEENSLLTILLPDVQANRDFARSLQVRIAERVGRGDVEGAWYDVMSMKHIARHYTNDSLIVTNLVGIAISNAADKSAKLILTHCRPTEEQFAKFARDLEILPSSNSGALSLTLERLVSFQMLQLLKHGKGRDVRAVMEEAYLNHSRKNDIPKVFSIISRLPFDANIAGKRLTKLYNEFGLKGFEIDKHFVCNPVLRRKYVKQLKKASQQVVEKIRLTNQLHRTPFIRTRSELLAECLFGYSLPALSSSYLAFDRYDAQNEMLRIAVALERYHLANGKYPENLNELVPKYLEMTPLDPCTGRASFVYKLRDATQETASESEQPSTSSTAKTSTTDETPKQTELPYILYSLGPNGKDDGGISSETSLKNYDCDFVF
ncbi:MAG: type IV pilin protein [Planctomycetaceae bacterium]|jgi:hypothetical protein|nr:type IV pilin protein [Planctomycetaceae bacterium]